MLNFLSFCLSVKLLSSLSYLNEILAGYSNLGCSLFSSITISMSCHSLWPEEFLLKGQLLSLWESPCVLFVIAPLLLLIFIFLCLIFVNLIYMCLGVFHLGFILFGNLWVSWFGVAISFSILGKLSNIISSSIFSCPFFLSFGTPWRRLLSIPWMAKR